jgi:hypothetical protein
MLAAWWYGVLREVWPRRPDLAVAAAVIPAHNLVDFSIYGSGVALPWAVLAGWTMAARPAGVRRAPARCGRVLVVVSATAALACSFLHATSQTLEAAAVLEPTASARYHHAMSARRIAPWRTEPLAVAAVAALESRDPQLIAAAASAMDSWLWLRPRSASAADLRAHLAEALGHAPAAISASWHAARSNPFNPTYAHHFERLVLRLDGSP